MRDIEYICEKLEQLLYIEIVCVEEKIDLSKSKQHAHHPIYSSENLCHILINGANQQRSPFIYRDEFQVCFACISVDEKHYMIGPMCTAVLNRTELRQYYSKYGIKEENEKNLKHFSIGKVLGIVEVLAEQLLNQKYTDEELLYANHLVEDTIEQVEKEQLFFELQEEEEELFHHTYQEECKLLECVREGRIEDAVRYSKNMDVYLGKLSTKEINHWKNVAIVAITLCTRASIEGGLSPSIAYRLSDFYIQKSDSCTDIAQVIDSRNRAVEELTRRVQRKRQSRSTSNYVEQCKDYVEKHYRNKIYLEDIAQMLGISSSYLSKRFHQDTGMRLQDYMVLIRVEHAANLLRFSEESIARIAEYVNFPSQSYFGKVFKEKYHMSPKAYRNLYKPSGF